MTYINAKITPLIFLNNTSIFMTAPDALYESALTSLRLRARGKVRDISVR